MLSKELGDKKFEDLIWHPVEQLSIHPYPLDFVNPLKLHENGEHSFGIGAMIQYKSASEANKELLELLAKGANFITIYNEIFDASTDFNTLFEGVFLDYIEVRFLSNRFNETFLDALEKFILSKESEAIRIILFEHELEKFDQNEISFRIQKHLTTKGSIIPFTIDASRMQNDGADAIHTLTYALWKAELLFEQIKTLSRQSLFRKSLMRFNLCVGRDYFMEIAKIETLRTLWSAWLKDETQFEHANTLIYVDTETELLTYTALDVENNILRATSAAMVAFVSRSSSHSVLPFDIAVENKRNFASRTALNIIHLLLEEGNMSQLPNVVNGAKYIEQIIKQLSENVIDLFKSLENLSREQIKDYFEKSTQSQRKVMERAFDEAHIISIGVNKFPHKNDRDKGAMHIIPGINRLSEVKEIEMSK